MNFINCSFYRNNASFLFNLNSIPPKKIQAQGCYFEMLTSCSIGYASTRENAGSLYSRNRHLSSGLCFAELRLEFPEEKETIEDEIKINSKRKHGFKIIVHLALLLSKS